MKSTGRKISSAQPDERKLSLCSSVRCLLSVDVSKKGGAFLLLMHSRSLLSQEAGEAILRAARKNLEVDGSLVSFLFITLTNGKRAEIPLRLPATIEDKETFFVTLGMALASVGETVSEAVMLSEGWVVNAKKSPAALKLPPSQHPSRQEAITIIGRNAKDTRSTCVVQPFSRSSSGKLIWEALMFALYDEQTQEGSKVQGLLDYLFIGQRQG